MIHRFIATACFVWSKNDHTHQAISTNLYIYIDIYMYIVYIYIYIYIYIYCEERKLDYLLSFIYLLLLS